MKKVFLALLLASSYSALKALSDEYSNTEEISLIKAKQDTYLGLFTLVVTLPTLGISGEENTLSTAVNVSKLLSGITLTGYSAYNWYTLKQKQRRKEYHTLPGDHNV